LSKELICKKLDTLNVIEKELEKRLKRMKTSTISLSISIANNDNRALSVVAKDYTRNIDENTKMLASMERMIEDIRNLLKSV